MLAPRPFIISLGLSCNNGCRFCSQADLRAEGADAGATDVARAIRAARDAGAEVIAFVGGEPTLRDDLLQWLAEAAGAGFARIGLQTNGRRLAYARYTTSLRDAGLTHVDVSLHGAGAALHDYHTRVPGSFKQTVSGIRRAAAAGLRVAVTTVLTRSNLRHLSSLADALGTLGVTQWRVMQARVIGRTLEDAGRLVARFETAAPQLEEAARRAAERGCSLALSGFPACVAPALRRFPLDAGGSFTPICESCGLRTRCQGVDAGYLLRYGAGELRPSRETEGSDVLGIPADSCDFMGGLGRPPI